MLVYKTSDGRFSIFQDGGGPTPWILKVGNINFQSGSEAQYASPCQISYANRSSRPGHGQISIFQDGGRPPFWVCFTRVWTTHVEMVFVIEHNLVGIGAVISIVCNFTYFVR